MLFRSVELFLDEKGEKIPKSRGNGLTIEEWLRYASPESLSMFMFHAPQRAKRLYFDVIPKNVDDYLGALSQYREQADTDAAKQLAPWFIHQGNPPSEDVPVSFAIDAYRIIKSRCGDYLCYSQYWVGSLGRWHTLNHVSHLEGWQVLKHTHGELGLTAAAAHHVMLACPNAALGSQQTAQIMAQMKARQGDLF